MFELVPHSVFSRNINREGCKEFQMDLPNIKTIPQLCETIGIPEADLLLPCILCDCFLHPSDIQNFKRGGFCLIWRVEGVHGICEFCSQLTAYFERSRFTERTLFADDYLAEFGDSIFCVPVRCILCLHKLSVPEIDCMVEASQQFTIVRGSVRGLCGACNT